MYVGSVNVSTLKKPVKESTKISSRKVSQNFLSSLCGFFLYVKKSNGPISGFEKLLVNGSLGTRVHMTHSRLSSTRTISK